MATPQYNRIIRKLITGFGNLFNNITLIRYNPDETEQERFLVPIAYAQKEKYVQRLEGDPNLDKKVQMTLPRMSYEMTGLKYDETRKQNTNFKNFANTPTGVKSQYNPVPYNFDFSLYLYVRNIEDGSQIIEYILPYFTPDYTIKLNLIPEMGQIKEIPIVLNSTEHEIQYEGSRDSDTRMVIWTLNFTVKGYIFGATNPTNLILTSITNILDNNALDTEVTFDMNTGGSGIYKQGEIVYQGYTLGTSTATATVLNWSNSSNQLIVSNITGNFISNTSIIGASTNANWTFNNYKIQPLDYVQIVSVPNPSNATPNSAYKYSTTIKETPNITNKYPNS